MLLSCTYPIILFRFDFLCDYMYDSYEYKNSPFIMDWLLSLFMMCYDGVFLCVEDVVLSMYLSASKFLIFLRVIFVDLANFIF
jgi:hypothetical protein